MRHIIYTAFVLALATCVSAQTPVIGPFHKTGQGVTPAFEGWFQNPDGTYSILFGYFNRNRQEELDIPIGPDNRIEPGGPDRGQPTHFLPGRQWGLFTVTVPKDFGDQKITWTLSINGQSNSIPASLAALWELQPLKDANGDTPPVLRFQSGASGQGPRPVTYSLSASAATPVALDVQAEDDAKLIPGMQRPKSPPVTLTWSKFRGPGAVTLANPTPSVEPSGEGGAAFSGKASTTVTFSEPGEYMLYLVANDWTGKGGRGFQCCWTNALVKVSVK